MNLRVILILTVLLAAVQFGFAQADVSEGFPYTGELTGTRVYVRCGPGEASGNNDYYVCTTLNSPDRVTVVESRNGWLRILPPKGCYSVIAAQFVDSSTSTVTANRVWVRPAGTMRNSNFNLGQIRLDKGDKVKIIGSVDADGRKWYTIESPENTYFWIFSKYVKKVSAPVVVENADQAAAVLESTEEIEKADTQTATTQPEDIPTASDSDTSADPLSSAVDTDTLKAFREIQTQMVEEYKKPVASRDLEGLVEKFKKMPLDEKSPLKPYVNYYVKYIEADIARASGLSQAETLARSTAEKQQKFDLERARQEIRQIEKTTAYAAEGILGTSQLFSGRVTGIKRYLVFDIATRKINAYIEADASLDLDKYLGKYVGIYGTSRYDKSLAVEIITASQLVVLSTDATFPMPPEPVVKPMTKPAFKPTGKLAGNVITVPSAPEGQGESLEELAETQPVAEEPQTPQPVIEEPKTPEEPTVEEAPAPSAQPQALKTEETKTVQDIEEQIISTAKPTTPEAPVAVTVEPLHPQEAPAATAPVEVKAEKDIQASPADLPAVEEPKIKIAQPLDEAKSQTPQIIEAPKVPAAEVKISHQPTAVTAPDMQDAVTTEAEKEIRVEIPAPLATAAAVGPEISEPAGIAVPTESPTTDNVKITAQEQAQESLHTTAQPAPAIEITPPQVKPEVKPVVKPSPVNAADLQPKALETAKAVATTQPATQPTTQPALKVEDISEGMAQPLPLEKMIQAIKPAENVQPQVLDIPDVEMDNTKPLPPEGLPLAKEKADSGVDESEYE